MSKKKYEIRFSMSDCSEYFKSYMRRISELTNYYQCLQSNKILHKARKVRFHKFLRMFGEIRWTFESSNIQIFENKNKYYSWNHSKMIKNLDFEIEKRIVILIIIFILASGVIIRNAIIQKRMQNWIQIFQVFVVTLFMILLDDLMSVFMRITYDSNNSSRCGKIPVPVQGFNPYFVDFINCFPKIQSFHFLSAMMF
jgi:hypothetical protein